MTDLEIAVEPAASAAVTALLDRYFRELAERFPTGPVPFDLGLIAAPAADFDPPHGAFLVARRDGRDVGCGAVRLLDRGTAEIKRMWVDPATRRSGVGRRLLAALEHAAAELGCNTVRLDTTAYLTEALALYLANGYREIPRYNDNPYSAHWLEKRLDSHARR
jgi:GNAT superfamily N-acetyltransferase